MHLWGFQVSMLWHSCSSHLPSWTLKARVSCGSAANWPHHCNRNCMRIAMSPYSPQQFSIATLKTQGVLALFLVIPFVILLSLLLEISRLFLLSQILLFFSQRFPPFHGFWAFCQRWNVLIFDGFSFLDLTSYQTKTKEGQANDRTWEWGCWVAMFAWSGECKALIFLRVWSFLLACSVLFCPPTILGDFYRISEKSPKSSADKMHRACE